MTRLPRKEFPVTGMRRFGSLLVCAAIAILAVPMVVMAQTEGMTYDEYKIQLAQYEQRTVAAKRSLAECKAAGEEISGQIADAEAKTRGVMCEIYALTDTDEAGFDAYMAELGRIESRLMALLGLSDDALFEVRDEFDGITERVEELQAKKMALYPANKAKLKNITQLIERITARMPAKRIKPYTVARNDNLWKIAKSQEIYGNAYLWPRIYVENRGLIKNPDLIYPSWVLNVPYGVDRGQHLVLQGNTLSTIAGDVYGDATKWHKIFEANKSQIYDANLIFPAQVLDVPGN